eukprot:scaffold22201_cov99-Skeletonema_marinoi.AAC.2
MNPSSPAANPSYQGNLMELYSGGRKQQLDSNENSNIVHGNGSPFDHLSGNNGSSEAAAYISAADNTIISNSGASSDNNSNSMKAKKQSNYHFLPSIMVTGSRREINSDSDEYVDNETSHYNQRNSHATMSSSDEDALRDVFSSQQHSSITSSSTVSANARMNNDRIQTKNDNTSTILPSQQQQQFKSALGQRIWNNYHSNRQQQQQQQQQLHNNNNTVTPPFILSQHHLPSTDFLRLPSKMVRIKRLSSQQQYNNDRNNEWANMDELERQVLQSHLDFETTASSLLHHDEVATNNNSIHGNDRLSSSSSSLLTSECFSRMLQRDSRCGLGMSLREYDGCVYIQALLRLDGSRMEFDNNGGDDDYDFNSSSNVNNNLSEEDAKSPAYAAGLHPGDRLLGLNGRPFLKGIKVPDLSSASVSSSDHIAADPEDVLRSVGDAISSAKSPLVLHIQRERDGHAVQELLVKLQSKSSRKVPMMQEKKRAMMSSGSNEATTKQPIPIQQQHYHSPLEQRPKPKPKGPYIHPFAKALADRSIIKHGKDEQLLTQQIRIFTDRTRQWESKLSFRLRASDFTLRPQLDARDVEPSYYASFLTDDDPYPPFFDYKMAKSIRSYAPSTPMIQDWRLSRGGLIVVSPARRTNRRISREAAVLADLYAGLDEDDAKVQDLILGEMKGGGGGIVSNNNNGEGGVAYPSSEMQVERAMGDASDLYVPLVGVRKAVCVRILNSFLDNKNRTAFTIWCFDIESGVEWYAPARYFSDFKDLRNALMRIDKAIGDIPFPSFSWSLGFPGISSEANESESTKQARRQQLENFLRNLFASVYRGRLNPYLAEVAVHLQTFIGCDTILTNGDTANLTLDNQVAINEITYGKRTPDSKSEQDNNARMHLKRSIQRYVYRLFLLPSVEKLVGHFVDTARQKVTSEASNFGPTKRQSVQFNVNKDVATADVEKIRDFIDQLQELIIDGCHEDFMSISQRRDFANLVDDVDNSIRDELFREAVREQVELEVYVPLRSTISKYLVYAWFNEDMEMKHKMKALENKPQSFFRIPKEHRSRSDWSSVSKILKEGVGRSTLPCVKLRAIVDAAKEITHLDAEERSVFPEATFFDGKVVTKTKTLGADDFLPIFIFCFVQAKIERPQALCALLQTMCDPAKMNGETGYYLSSFHAAMTHIHEDLDLSEVNDELAIFLESS